jgi:hypothetical protein
VDMLAGPKGLEVRKHSGKVYSNAVFCIKLILVLGFCSCIF